MYCYDGANFNYIKSFACGTHTPHTHYTRVTNRLKRHRIFCDVSCFTVILKRESISSLVSGQKLKSGAETSVTCPFEFKFSEQYWSQYSYLHS